MLEWSDIIKNSILDWMAMVEEYYMVKESEITIDISDLTIVGILPPDCLFKGNKYHDQPARTPPDRSKCL